MSLDQPEPDDEASWPPSPSAWRQFASAPLAPVAVAVTLGLMLDRYVGMPVAVGLFSAVAAAIGWFLARERSPAAHVLLWISAGGLAAAYHHSHRHVFPPDDIGAKLTTNLGPLAVRGTLVEAPFTRRAPTDPLQPAHKKDMDVTVLDVAAVQVQNGGWEPASGKLRLTVKREAVPAGQILAPLGGLRVGDEVQVVGLAARPDRPSNPGEKNYADFLLDQRIRGDMRADTTSAVVRIDPAGTSLNSTLAAIRGRAVRILTDELPAAAAPIARALLLGDGSAMERTEWDAFIRTGVVHVLAISGQHLVLIAAFVWVLAAMVGVPRYQAAWAVMIVVVGYAMVTGLRPSSVRAAVMVAAVCGAIILRRPIHTANAFSAAWLAVVCLNPTDIFTLGCQLSFISVFVLIWGAIRWIPRFPDDQESRLQDLFRPAWLRWLRTFVRVVWPAYLVNFLLFVVNSPLLIADQNLVSPVGVLVGPVLVLLTSVGLVAGFLLLLLTPIPLVSDLLALITRLALNGCDLAVKWADGLPGGSVYVVGFPSWWYVGFYLLVAAAVFAEPRQLKRVIVLVLSWILLGALVPMRADPAGELRTTFLAVGHGGCTVMETPEGRCFIYDVGSTGGPDAVKRVIAPYLWSRGISRVDEVFLSHADSDHFNNLPELMRRFPVGRVTLTPSFATKPVESVAATLLAIEKYRVPVQVVSKGERFSAGNVSFEVLHPPNDGPAGEENARSLVLAVRHAGHVMLLTGDLEKAGTAKVLEGSPVPTDVLLAPHHGSRAAFTSDLRDWCQPRFVAVSRGEGVGTPIGAEAAGPGVLVWDTASYGAITVRSHATGLIAEAVRDGTRVVITRGGKRD